MYVGKKIKALRKAQGIKLIELAEKSGVQIATLSRIEHEKMVGSLESHMNIAKALGIDVTQLYSDVSKNKTFVDIMNGGPRTDVYVGSNNSTAEILTNKVLSKKMLPSLISIEPEGSTNKEQNKPGAEKFVYILQGSAQIVIDGKAYSLSSGNTMYFDSSLEHYFINNGKKQARILAVETPVNL